MAIGDVFRMALRFRNASATNTFISVFHYRQEENLIIDEPGEDLIQAFQLDAEAAYLGCISSNLVLTDYSVRGVTTPTYGFDLSGLTLSALVAGQMLPPQDAYIITWRTGLIGRRFRGRTFVPGVSEAQQDEGLLSTAIKDSLQDFADVAILIGDSLTTATWQLVVRSETYDLNTPVVNGFPRDRTGTQRRRKLGVGI